MNQGFTALLFFMTFLRIAPGFVVMDLEQAHRIMEEQKHSLQPLDGSFGPFVQAMIPNDASMSAGEIDELLRNGRHHLESIAIPKSEVKYVIRLKKDGAQAGKGQELGGSFGNTRDELRALFTKHLRDQARRF